MSILIIDNGPLPRIIRQAQWIKSYLPDMEAEIVYAVHNQIPTDVEKPKPSSFICAAASYTSLPEREITPTLPCR